MIIEDAAQGFGGRIRGEKAGSFGDVAATSFFPAKPLGCTAHPSPTRHRFCWTAPMGASLPSAGRDPPVASLPAPCSMHFGLRIVPNFLKVSENSHLCKEYKYNSN